MGCFNDLPHDVVWLIFQRVLWSSHPYVGYNFTKLEVDGWSYSNDWGMQIVDIVHTLAVINVKR